MSDGSTIEWLKRPGTKPATWNPIRARNTFTGKIGWHCVHVHEGCRFCYAESFNRRLGTGENYTPGAQADRNGLVETFLDEITLLQPLRWKHPRTIFVCSMTDLYGPWVKDEWLDKIKAVQALTPQHTYIELTKRPERMRDYLTYSGPGDGVMARIADATRALAPLRKDLPTPPSVYEMPVGPRMADGSPEFGFRRFLPIGPLKNVWGLVSCSTQEDADKFVPILLSTPLAIRGVSAEPLLVPIDFDAWLRDGAPRIDWIIDGGESGMDARDYDIAASRDIERHCITAGVAYFRKQLGAKPFEREPSVWPRSDIGLLPDGFGRYHVLGLKSRKGADPAEWPSDLRRHEFPQARTA